MFFQKKALQVQKTPRPEPEPSPVLNPKRPKETARDAREIAKKLLKSGAIGPIKKVPNRTDQESFKRPCGMERKMLCTPQTLTSYQPFSAAASAATVVKTDIPDSTPKASPTTKFSVLILHHFDNCLIMYNLHNKKKILIILQNLYNNFVSSTSKTTPTTAAVTAVVATSGSPEPAPEPPRKGITIFVGGSSAITEEFLRTAFSKFGTIINISMEVEKK